MKAATQITEEIPDTIEIARLRSRTEFSPESAVRFFFVHFMPNLESRKVFAALALGVVSIAFAAIFFREALPTDAWTASGWRLLLASLVMLPFVWRAYRAAELSRQLVLAAIGAGVLYAVHFGAWVTSLEYTSVAASVTLVTSTPALLVLWAWWTGTDRPSARLVGAVLVSLVGVLLIGGGDFGVSPQALWGDFLAWIGAVAMAVYLVVVRRLGQFPVMAFSGMATLTGGLVLMLGAWLRGVELVPASPRAAFFIVLATVVPQLIGHTLMTWSLRHTTPTVVGLATLVEPVGAALLAWAIYAEMPTPLVALGCVVTVVGVGIATRR